MSYNIGGVTAKGDKLFKLNDFLKKEDCDIVCVQEFSSPDAFKYQLENTVALSKYPYK